MREFIVEADGGSRGNPGPAGYGAVVSDAATGETLTEAAEYIGVATNNVAEYRGLLAGLRAARDLDPSARVHVRMDSKLVVEQMSGRWKVKHPAMKPLAAEAGRVFAPGRVTYEWIPRERNRHADRLANEAMDAGAEGRQWSPAASPASPASRAPLAAPEEPARPGDATAGAARARAALRAAAPADGPGPVAAAGAEEAAGTGGADGTAGADGARRAAGADGARGAAGTNGAAGTGGADGAAGTGGASRTDGLAVTDGVAGTDGAAGAGLPAAEHGTAAPARQHEPSTLRRREPAGPAGHRVSTPGWSAAPDLGAPATFVLLRHGETPLTPQKRFSGSGGGDPSLSDTGREQARRVAAALARRGTVQAIVASPLARTRETAGIVAARLGLDVEVEEGLRETDFGAWEGLTFGEARERHPDDLDAWLADPEARPTGGGESFAQTAVRIEATRRKLVAAHAGRTVLLVTHVTPIKTFVRLALGAPPASLFRMELSAASLSAVAYYADGNASVRLFNDTSHLRS
ncbi:bifunctional RNase H/acid phosphatase [Streptomyces sp. TG1A-8]|uniref:bifunctional RNase H/acid phosphatase n=1 Tax=Streptomyces sp. TG1A-8 TaxID=3051385 RepID=UPI00265BA091|nr:bifunctional RNase H/acid phosphatase [Streptomyces sp. TG1A-8]MDO0927956.1 bifunctional RNase H/acid phosphatase [Streptomyces sp. TG1A-8]